MAQAALGDAAWSEDQRARSVEAGESRGVGLSGARGNIGGFPQLGTVSGADDGAKKMFSGPARTLASDSAALSSGSSSSWVIPSVLATSPPAAPSREDIAALRLAALAGRPNMGGVTSHTIATTTATAAASVPVASVATLDASSSTSNSAPFGMNFYNSVNSSTPMPMSTALSTSQVEVLPFI